MFIDSHCHLHFIDFESSNLNEDDFVMAARNERVEHILCVATHLKQHATLQALCNKYAEISMSVGLHPNELIDKEPDVAAFLKVLHASGNEKVVAIGETGLDYYRTTSEHSCQCARFRTQIQVAKACQKPLIVHTRDATADTLHILTEERAADVGGVFHCFTGDWDFAKCALDMGFYISFSGIVTFSKSQLLQDIAKKVPLDRILVETDSPYLAPTPFRGKVNQPAYIRYIVEFIAELRGMTVVELAQSTTSNYYKLFGQNS